jgi:hypothetical protein
VRDDGSEEASGPSARDGEEEPNDERGGNTSAALIDVRECEQKRRNHNSDKDETAGDALHDCENKTAIEKFLAQGRRCGEDGEGQRLEAFLGKQTPGDLAEKPLAIHWQACEATQADELVRDEEGGKADSNIDCQGGFRKSERQIGKVNAPRDAAPQHQGSKQPLEGDCGSVDQDALVRADLRAAEEPANLYGAAPGHNNREEKEQKRKIPPHTLMKPFLGAVRKLKATCLAGASAFAATMSNSRD